MGKQRIYIVAGLSLFIWTVAACSASRPVAQVDYAQYSTYAFGTSSVSGSDNPVFSWVQFRSRVRNEVDFTLPSVGLDYSPEQPDLLIYFYAVSEADEERPVLPYRLGWHAEPFISAGEHFETYPANTLVIDFVDTNLNELIWRGSTSIPFDNEEVTYRNLSERIRQLIRSYPDAPLDDQTDPQ